jgi:hypothetical protein
MTAAIQVAQANMAARTQSYGDTINQMNSFITAIPDDYDSRTQQPSSDGSGDQSGGYGGGGSAPPPPAPSAPTAPAPTSAPRGSVNLSGIPPASIDYLKKNPGYASVFDQHYNRPGAAEQILGQQ